MRPYLRVRNVFEDRIDLTDVKEMDFSPADYERYKLEPGDILLNEGQSPELIGRPAMYRGELPGSCFTNSLIRFRPRTGVDGRFALYLFRHYLRSGRFRQEARITTNIAHLSARRFSSIEFPVPPLNEQQRIVTAIEERFSRLDAADQSLREAARRLKQLRAAILLECFEGSWPAKLLADITDPQRPVRYGILMPKENVEDGVLYVRVRDYPRDRIELSGLRRTSHEIAAKYKRATLRPGDVLLAIRGTYGRVAIVPPELDGGNITQDTARIAPTSEVDPAYIAAYLRSEAAQRHFRRVARGVAVKGVNIGDLRTMRIPVPPLEEQHRIVQVVEELISIAEAMEHAIMKATRRSASLRRSILDHAFRGELVPQDPTDEPASVLLEGIVAEQGQRTLKRQGKARP
jgi:type I restriction enzyme, S subunit